MSFYLNNPLTKKAFLLEGKTCWTMRVKIDTKEKFHVINIQEPVFSANMTGELDRIVEECRAGSVKNIIIHLGAVSTVEPEAALHILQMQQSSYEQEMSFVVCAVPDSLEQWLDEQDLLEQLNATPTESEAWDIVQMEEIEREMF